MLILPKDYFLLRYPIKWENGDYNTPQHWGGAMFTKQQRKSGEIDVLDVGEYLVLMGKAWHLSIMDSILGGILLPTKTETWPSLYVVSKEMEMVAVLLEASEEVTEHIMQEIKERPQDLVKAATESRDGCFEFQLKKTISDSWKETTTYGLFMNPSDMCLLDLEI